MKKLLALLAFITGLTLLSPGTAQARHSDAYSSSTVARHCGSCGGAIYRARVVVAYDDCGYPVYGWRTLSHRCQHHSRSHSHHSYHSSGHHSSHHKKHHRH